MERYEVVKYHVQWQGGEGVYYPEVDFLDVSETSAQPSAAEMDKLCAMCAKHHRRAVASDFRTLLILVVSLVAGATLIAWLK